MQEHFLHIFTVWISGGISQKTAKQGRMMKTRQESSHSWQGKSLRVHVLHSRAGVAQHIWISNDHGAVLIDAGDGLLRDILAGRLGFDRIRGIFFTHGHFDHMGGLHTLLGFLRMIGRKDPLPIAAPEGCTEVFSTVDEFKRCYAGTIPFDISCKTIQPHEISRIAGMSLEAYPVIHCGGIEGSEILKQIPAFGYKISYKGETVAISGDTGDCPSLRELVTGADLAILEATYESSDEVSSETLRKVHLSEDLAEEIGHLAESHILIHKGRRT